MRVLHTVMAGSPVYSILILPQRQLPVGIVGMAQRDQETTDLSEIFSDGWLFVDLLQNRSPRGFSAAKPDGNQFSDIRRKLLLLSQRVV